MAKNKSNGNANGRKPRGRPRRSKAEDMTEEKANGAEMRTASQGQMDLPAPNDIVFHMKTIKGLKDSVSTMQGHLRKALQSAKECNPFLPVTIKELLALERLDDPAKFKARMEALGIGLKTIGAPYQLTLHDTLLGDEKESAAKRGYANGKAGTALSNPFPELSDLAAIYDDAYTKGQTEYITGAPAPNDDASTDGDADVDDGPFPSDHNERELEEAH